MKKGDEWTNCVNAQDNGYAKHYNEKWNWGLKMKFQRHKDTKVMRWTDCDPTKPRHCRKDIKNGVCVKMHIVDADFNNEVW